MIEIFGLTIWRVLIGTLSILPLIYWFLTKNYSYWSKRGINGPKPILLFGNFLDRVKNPLGDLDMGYIKKFGNIYGVFNGTDPILQIAEPTLIKQVLVKDFSSFSNRRDLRTEHPIVNKNLFNSRVEDWKRLRTICSSAFTSGKLKKLYILVRKCLEEYLVHLEDIATSGKELNVKDMHQNFTMDVIASTAFATHINAQKDPNSKFVQSVRSFFVMKPLKWIPAFVFPKSFNKLLGIRTQFDESVNEYIFGLTRHVMHKRMNGEKNNDFIQLLMDAKADEVIKKDINDNLESHHINEGEDEVEALKKIYNNNYAVNKLTEDEILAQSWVILLAGFETTATTLGYLSYELALNPECQEKLYKEVISAFDSNHEISYEVLQRLPYLDAAVSETLRKYPPLTRLEREVTEKVTLVDINIDLFKGQTVEIPVYAIHHSEQYYKNAEKFIPDRFLAENRDQLVPYTYLPFGTGPRNCIGMRFGLMEVKLAIAHIVRKYRFKKSTRTVVPLQFQNLTPLLSVKDIWVGIEKR